MRWDVAPAGYAARGARECVFAYRRTWDGPGGERLAVDAEEAITFDEAGKVVKIAYTRAPSEPVSVVG